MKMIASLSVDCVYKMSEFYINFISKHLLITLKSKPFNYLREECEKVLFYVCLIINILKLNKAKSTDNMHRLVIDAI